MFKFGFSEETEDNSAKTSKTEDEKSSLDWLESEELNPSKSQAYQEMITPKYNFTNGFISISYVSAQDSIKNTSKDKSDLIELAEQLHSDLIPSKYEGGMKIWECTFPLIEYFIKEKVSFKGRKVLDLGCGAGLLGIYALLQEALVTFQDYNAEVIESVTYPNVLLNTTGKTEEELKKISKFFMGDWASFVELLLKEVESEEDKYDVILSSETIYNAENHWKLLLVLKKLLKHTGVAYPLFIQMKTKTFYFGVGGGLRQFEKKLEAEGCFESSVCWKSSEGS
ncbi:hypothetical protein J437_LFUL013556 [Ladona fulva]|uniref:protein-histidine N-methyltransferase n=1 Tax=Ladona fulva TaxID=123851 RepID=A0A8K0KI22_LADFU|nr:hypothetical protein J437_LFUL013556 [Ladona fulva]